MKSVLKSVLNGGLALVVSLVISAGLVSVFSISLAAASQL
jgi:hypothetical protein